MTFIYKPYSPLPDTYIFVLREMGTVGHGIHDMTLGLDPTQTSQACQKPCPTNFPLSFPPPRLLSHNRSANVAQAPNPAPTSGNTPFHLHRHPCPSSSSSRPPPSDLIPAVTKDGSGAGTTAESKAARAKSSPRRWSSERTRDKLSHAKLNVETTVRVLVVLVVRMGCLREAGMGVRMEPEEVRICLERGERRRG